MAIKNSASAKWEGSLKEGAGHVSTGSGVLDDTPYSFKKRFEGEKGSNPEELVGAAHAACYSMALSMILGENTPDKIETKATVTLDEDGEGFSVKKIHLDVTGHVPGISAEDFADAAEKAKAGCPISKLYEGGTAEITMDAKLA